MINLNTTLTIDRLGQKGEGVARGPYGAIFVPYALAGETITAEVDGERGAMAALIAASPDRIPAFCPYYTQCGGCAVQTLAWAPYAAWKRGLLVGAMRHAGLGAEPGELVDAHGEGRRRATFHARVDPASSRVTTGFMQARSHAIVAIEACPILAPSMAGAVAAARAVAQALRALGKPLDIVVTATEAGLDVDARGAGKLDFDARQRLIDWAVRLDLARVSNHGDVVIERRAPLLRMGLAEVAPPPGAFLQATVAGEELLAAHVADATAGARRVADLFSGIGTFALRLAGRAEVHAVEADSAALNAFSRAARASVALRAVSVEPRDLVARPLSPAELNRYDAVVFDPPRAGAEAQARALAGSKVGRVIAVSCNVQSFSRDAAILVAGGYRVASVTPFDQFRHSAHVEIVGVFERDAAKPKRRMLG